MHKSYMTPLLDWLNDYGSEFAVKSNIESYIKCIFESTF